MNKLSSRGRTPKGFNEVMPADGGGWMVKAGGKGALGIYQRKEDAVKAARATVMAKGGGLVVHTRDGRISRESFTIGRDTFEKISAVEGISPSSEARERTAEFERKGLASENRRRAIIEAYRAKR